MFKLHKFWLFGIALWSTLSFVGPWNGEVLIDLRNPFRIENYTTPNRMYKTYQSGNNEIGYEKFENNRFERMFPSRGMSVDQKRAMTLAMRADAFIADLDVTEEQVKQMLKNLDENPILEGNRIDHLSFQFLARNLAARFPNLLNQIKQIAPRLANNLLAFSQPAAPMGAVGDNGQNQPLIVNRPTEVTPIEVVDEASLLIKDRLVTPQFPSNEEEIKVEEGDDEQWFTLDDQSSHEAGAQGSATSWGTPSDQSSDRSSVISWRTTDSNGSDENASSYGSSLDEERQRDFEQYANGLIDDDYFQDSVELKPRDKYILADDEYNPANYEGTDADWDSFMPRKDNNVRSPLSSDRASWGHYEADRGIQETSISQFLAQNLEQKNQWLTSKGMFTIAHNAFFQYFLGIDFNALIWQATDGKGIAKQKFDGWLKEQLPLFHSAAIQAYAMEPTKYDQAERVINFLRNVAEANIIKNEHIVQLLPKLSRENSLIDQDRIASFIDYVGLKVKKVSPFFASTINHSSVLGSLLFLCAMQEPLHKLYSKNAYPNAQQDLATILLNKSSFEVLGVNSTDLQKNIFTSGDFAADWKNFKAKKTVLNLIPNSLLEQEAFKSVSKSEEEKYNKTLPNLNQSRNKVYNYSLSKSNNYFFDAIKDFSIDLSCCSNLYCQPWTDFSLEMLQKNSPNNWYKLLARSLSGLVVKNIPDYVGPLSQAMVFGRNGDFKGLRKIVLSEEALPDLEKIAKKKKVQEWKELNNVPGNYELKNWVPSGLEFNANSLSERINWVIKQIHADFDNNPSCMTLDEQKGMKNLINMMREFSAGSSWLGAALKGEDKRSGTLSNFLFKILNSDWIDAIILDPNNRNSQSWVEYLREKKLFINYGDSTLNLDMTAPGAQEVVKKFIEAVLRHFQFVLIDPETQELKTHAYEKRQTDPNKQKEVLIEPQFNKEYLAMFVDLKQVQTIWDGFFDNLQKYGINFITTPEEQQREAIENLSLSRIDEKKIYARQLQYTDLFDLRIQILNAVEQMQKENNKTAYSQEDKDKSFLNYLEKFFESLKDQIIALPINKNSLISPYKYMGLDAILSEISKSQRVSLQGSVLARYIQGLSLVAKHIEQKMEAVISGGIKTGKQIWPDNDALNNSDWSDLTKFVRENRRYENLLAFLESDKVQNVVFDLGEYKNIKHEATSNQLYDELVSRYGDPRKGKRGKLNEAERKNELKKFDVLARFSSNYEPLEEESNSSVVQRAKDSVANVVQGTKEVTGAAWNKVKGASSSVWNAMPSVRGADKSALPVVINGPDDKSRVEGPKIVSSEQEDNEKLPEPKQLSQYYRTPSNLISLPNTSSVLGKRKRSDSFD